MKFSRDILYSDTRANDISGIIFLGSTNNKDYYLCDVNNKFYNAYVIEVRNNSYDGYGGYYISNDYISNLDLNAAVQKARRLLLLK